MRFHSCDVPRAQGVVETEGEREGAGGEGKLFSGGRVSDGEDGNGGGDDGCDGHSSVSVLNTTELCIKSS